MRENLRNALVSHSLMVNEWPPIHPPCHHSPSMPHYPPEPILMPNEPEPANSISWEFSTPELLLIISLLFLLFFLGYFTRAWSEPPPPNDTWLFKPPSVGAPYSFRCEGHTGDKL